MTKIKYVLSQLLSKIINTVKHFKNLPFDKQFPILVGAFSIIVVVTILGYSVAAQLVKPEDKSKLVTTNQTTAATINSATNSSTAPSINKPTTTAKPAPAKIKTTTGSTSKSSSSSSSSSTSSSSGHFSTLAVGASLPSDATCSSRVRSAAETRSANNTANHTKGTAANSLYPRVDGNFIGTTDEIIQWASCKWGIDEDIARAQAAKESWWFQRTLGDFGADSNACLPGHSLGSDGTSGQCPQSVGLLQVRYPYHQTAFVSNSAAASTAYNIDYMYAVWRECYNGSDTWLNTVDHGATYNAGDLWGCIGVWYAGRYMTSPAVTYINGVKDYLNQKVWTTASFKSAT